MGNDYIPHDCTNIHCNSFAKIIWPGIYNPEYSVPVTLTIHNVQPVLVKVNSSTNRD